MILFILSGVEMAYGQGTAILSDKHLNKIENAKSAHDKLRLYKKFYTKDSTKLAREFDKYLGEQSDSIYNALQDVPEVRPLSMREQRRLKRATEKLTEQKSLIDARENMPDSAAVLRRVSELTNDKIPGFPIPRDSTAIKQEIEKEAGLLKSQPALKEANELTGEAKSYEAKANRYKNQITGLEIDSITRADIKRNAMAQAQNRVSRFKELRALEQQKKSMERLRASPAQYKEKSGQLQDSAYVKEQAKKKAEETAMNYLTKNPGVMDAVRKKTGLLMKVYSIVPNSNDLSTAVKRSSLEGHSFKERLFVGGNLQLISFKPVSIEFSPIVGYRITSRLIGGIGINYRKTFNDTLSRVASDMIGYRGFVSYDAIANFFVYSEYSRNAAILKQTEVSQSRSWNSAFMLGMGRKISLRPRLEMTAIILYNVTHKSDNSVYTNRWIFRIGFQTSALGFIKRKPEFNPR